MHQEATKLPAMKVFVASKSSILFSKWPNFGAKKTLMAGNFGAPWCTWMSGTFLWHSNLPLIGPQSFAAFIMYARYFRKMLVYVLIHLIRNARGAVFSWHLYNKVQSMWFCPFVCIRPGFICGPILTPSICIASSRHRDNVKDIKTVVFQTSVCPNLCLSKPLFVRTSVCPNLFVRTSVCPILSLFKPLFPQTIV